MNADGTGNKLVVRTISGLKTTDRESSLQFDGEYRDEKGWLQSVESGVRFSDHHRDSERRYPAYRSADLNNAAPTSFIPFPSDFGAGLDGRSGWDNTGFTFTPEALKAYFAANTKATTDQYERRTFSELHMRERQSAAYVMANREGNRWSGNVGLRLVRTQVNADIPTPIAAGKCQRTEPGKPATTCALYPDAVTTAGDLQPYYDNVPFDPNTGTMYYFAKTDRTYNNLLPSLNLRYELSKDMIARFGANRTISRQNYNLLGAGFGTPTCDAAGCHVTGPNPDLTPLTSDNLDTSWAWYFAPRSLVSVDLFYSRIEGYAKTDSSGGATVDLFDEKSGTMIPYFVNSSSQQGAWI